MKNKDKRPKQAAPSASSGQALRKQAEQSLRESEEHYRGLFEDSPISLWEEDFSAVKQRLEALRKRGVKKFRTY